MQKALPIGVMNYQELQTNGYYSVDKTLMIQEFLQRKSKVTLITRPRRFGKTLNMSMLAEFFDITKDSRSIFKDTKIMETEYITEMNQYPTIFISFADCKGDFDNTKMSIFYLFRLLLAQHLDFLAHEHVSKDLKNRYQELYEDMCNEKGWNRIQFVIVTVCELLYEVYQKPVILLIDEYDTPFIEAHVNGFYEQFHLPMAGLLIRALKTNNYLGYAMLTGIQRVAKENIFSGMNNLKVFTVKDNEYSQCFGFTKEETKELLEYYGLSYGDEVKQMYDGYHMGDIDIYNPWSIINYADEKELKTYWVNTSSNTMIKKAMEQSDMGFKEKYEKLILEGYLDTPINMETSFYESSNTKSLWGLLVNAGYLTIEKTLRLNQYRIRIPNNEVREEFMSLTANHLKLSETTLNDMFYALENKEKNDFLASYQSILLQMSSYHDLENENSYHMLLLGMCAWLQSDYKIQSNRETGKGRCDILMASKKNYLPSFIIELKYMNTDEYKKHPESLKKLAIEAIEQINQLEYGVELTGEIIHVGLAHAGKTVEMEWRQQE